MGQKKCQVCGKTFYNDNPLDGSLATQIPEMFTKVMCPDCKRMKKLGGESSSSESSGGTTVVQKGPSAGAELAKGFSSMMGDTMKMSFNKMSEDKASIKEGIANAESKFQEIIDLKFGEDPQEICDILDRLFLEAMNYNTSFGATLKMFSSGGFKSENSSNKKVLVAMKEKIQKGIMTLKSLGKTAEAEYYQKKLESDKILKKA